MKPKISFQTYPDHGGEWRWRALARNGRVVADSAEGYKTERNADRASAGFQAGVVESA